jgi:hypothetical protein
MRNRSPVGAFPIEMVKAEAVDRGERWKVDRVIPVRRDL